MKKLSKQLVVVAMMALVFSFTALPALAQGPVNPFGTNQLQENVNQNLGLGNRDPREIAASAINVIMGFLGIIAVVIILIGGFKWMTAAGEESKVEEAKKLMTAGVIGLVIILAAWGITIFVMNALLSATGAQTNV